MANPRQRSKAKSHKSTKPFPSVKRRMHHRLRKAPPLKGPEVLQKGWDRRKTVIQNYAALGLLHSIPLPRDPSSSRTHRAELQLLGNKENTAAVVGYGRIIRDEEGNVIDIILPQEEDGTEEVEQSDLAAENAEEDKTDVVKALEKIASTTIPVTRHTSTAEKTWLHSLISAHGDNYDSMARDRKLNAWQKTSGEIKRAVRKAGGTERLARQIRMEVD